MAAGNVGIGPITKEILDGPYVDWFQGASLRTVLESARMPQSRVELERYLDTVMADPNSFMFGIHDRIEGALVGTIKVSGIEWVARVGGIGILIGAEEKRGMGYGQQALSLFTDYCFRDLNLHKLYAGVSDHNQPSQKIFERAGFSFEARRRHQLFVDGAYRDQLLYAYFQSDWVARGNEKTSNELKTS